MKRDYIERHGKFTENGDPVELLAEEIHKLKPISTFMTKDRIAEELRKMLEEGIFNYTKDDSSITWFWNNASRKNRQAEILRNA